nr:hypothetical protein HK105_003724 [Polyrhizophydium stewartii]
MDWEVSRPPELQHDGKLSPDVLELVEKFERLHLSPAQAKQPSKVHCTNDPMIIDVPPIQVQEASLDMVVDVFEHAKDGRNGDDGMVVDVVEKAKDDRDDKDGTVVNVLQQAEHDCDDKASTAVDVVEQAEVDRNKKHDTVVEALKNAEDDRDSRGSTSTKATDVVKKVEVEEEEEEEEEEVVEEGLAIMPSSCPKEIREAHNALCLEEFTARAARAKRMREDDVPEMVTEKPVASQSEPNGIKKVRIVDSRPASLREYEKRIKPVKPVTPVTPVTPATPVIPVKPVRRVRPVRRVKQVKRVTPVAPVTPLEFTPWISLPGAQPLWQPAVQPSLPLPVAQPSPA